MDDGPAFTYEKEVLASGAFGKVHKGTLKDAAKTLVVVKVPKNKKASKSVEEEFAFLRTLRRTPGIVHVYSMRKSKGICTIALERATGSVRVLLDQHPVGFPLGFMKILVGDLKIGLRELLTRNILHRDIKPDNILYFRTSQSSCIFKLSDFGVSKAVDSMEDTAKSICGTMIYMAPQLLGYYLGVDGCPKPRGNHCDSKDGESWQQMEKIISNLLRQIPAKVYLPLMANFADRPRSAEDAERRRNTNNNEDRTKSYMPVVGIDLGTTFSVAGIVLPNGKYAIVDRYYRKGKLTPSCVAFADSRVLIGADAVEQLPDNHANTITQVKRFMGRCAKDLPDTRDFNHVLTEALPLTAGDFRDDPKYMKMLAERALSEATGGEAKIVDAVITVPANFNNHQRKATRDAASIAGLNVLRLLNEPTAAAIAYGMQGNNKKGRKILVYDLGGGTFDVSIIEMEEHANVLVTMGNLNLGGEDFDKALLDQIITEANLRLIKNEELKLRAKCELAKRELKEKESVTIMLPNNKPFTISREIFTVLIEHHLQETITTVEDAMVAAKLRPADIDDVVLVGGSTRIPRVSELLSEIFGQAKLRRDIDADEAVAMGAIILANETRSGSTSAIFTDVIPKGLGFAVSSQAMNRDIFEVLIPAFTRIPAEGAKSGYTNTYDEQNLIFIEVYEGNSEDLEKDHKIGEFDVSIIPRKAGRNNIEVKFSVDLSGILTVTATDKDTDIARSIKIKSGALTEDRVDAMRAVAEQMMRKDEQENHLLELRSKIEKRLREVQHLAKEQPQLERVCELKEDYAQACEGDANERMLEWQCSDLEKLKIHWENEADIKVAPLK